MANHHSVDIQGGTSPKTLSAYLTGFVLCVILSVMAFLLVGKQLLSGADLYIALAALAVIQLLVQVTCFLRLNASPAGQWNLMPFLFTLVVVGILVSGSLWIMYNMNYYMQM